MSLRRDDFVSHEAPNYVEIGPQEELRVFPDGGRHIIERDLRDHAASCMGGGTADRPDRRSMRQTTLWNYRVLSALRISGNQRILVACGVENSMGLTRCEGALREQ